MARRCESPIEGCRYANTEQCLITEHHLFYPANEYTTPLDRIYRNLEENKVELARCEHDQVHATEETPIKPSVEVMRHAVETAVQNGSISLTRKKRKALWKAV